MAVGGGRDQAETLAAVAASAVATGSSSTLRTLNRIDPSILGTDISPRRSSRPPDPKEVTGHAGCCGLEYVSQPSMREITTKENKENEEQSLREAIQHRGGSDDSLRTEEAPERTAIRMNRIESSRIELRPWTGIILLDVVGWPITNNAHCDPADSRRPRLGSRKSPSLVGRDRRTAASLGTIVNNGAIEHG